MKDLSKKKTIEELKTKLKQLINNSKFHHSNTTDKSKSMYYYGMITAYEGILKMKYFTEN